MEARFTLDEVNIVRDTIVAIMEILIAKQKNIWFRRLAQSKNDSSNDQATILIIIISLIAIVSTVSRVLWTTAVNPKNSPHRVSWLGELSVLASSCMLQACRSRRRSVETLEATTKTLSTEKGPMYWLYRA